jgi:phenylacetate-coenzyme A ligase PaaK-like adenylate-forming protein
MYFIKKLIHGTISKITGNDYSKEYCELNAINTQEKLSSFLQCHISSLLLHADSNVPYYHDIFQKINLTNKGTIDLSKFADIPLLTKELLRTYHDQIISKDYTTRKWYYNSSGGSTGEPVSFIQDDNYVKWGNATKYYYYQDILKIDEQHVKKILLWGSPRDLSKDRIGFRSKINEWLKNTVILNSFKMTEKDMFSFIKIINTYKPDLIRGYASSLYELVRFAERNNLQIYTPKILTSSAETLRDEMREQIETGFGTKLYDFYGSREVSNLAGECRNNLMHVFMFWNYVEILDHNNQPVKECEEGKVVVTNLYNYSMPLIRYVIGDIAELGPENCKCGNILPTLKKVVGRLTDHFVKADGTIIHGEYFTHLFYFKEWIRVFQVVQEEYMFIKILIVPEGNINEFEKKDIENKIKLLMGQDCKIVWEFVEEIPKSNSGKYLYTKSLVWR